MRKHRVAAIPGDGIGTEVVAAARVVLDLALQRSGAAIDWLELDWSGRRYESLGAYMPDDGLEVLAATEAIFLGAVGWPTVPDHVSLWSMLIPIRRTFDQYVNLRPVHILPGVQSPLRDLDSIDLVIVRENVEGEYSQVGGRVGPGQAPTHALQQSVFSRDGVSKVARFAADVAARRGGRLISATKSNGLVHTMPFWDEVVSETCAAAGVPVEPVHIDALVARMVSAPRTCDVILGSNLFGDILSDLAAAIAGSLGVAPSGNINPERRYPSMFEPVHGSAPDIAGRHLANPVGAMWAGVMMLEHLAEVDAAQVLFAAMEGTLASGVRTRDLGGNATTEQFTRAVVDRLTMKEN